jgi:hypothetical protein
LSVDGVGCIPDSPVVFTVDHLPAGQATANQSGGFTAPIVVPNVAVGQYAVTASCGPTIAADLNVTLLTDASPNGLEYVVLLFFVLAGLILLQLILRLGRRQ